MLKMRSVQCTYVEKMYNKVNSRIKHKPGYVLFWHPRQLVGENTLESK